MFIFLKNNKIRYRNLLVIKMSNFDNFSFGFDKFGGRKPHDPWESSDSFVSEAMSPEVSYLNSQCYLSKLKCENPSKATSLRERIRFLGSRFYGVEAIKCLSCTN